MTLVSVIIPTYNRSALLRQAIESVLAAQREGIELEILVVDDGSTDATSEVVKDYPVVYLRQSGGPGPANSRNLGMEAARGEYIAFLDDDDVWLPTHLATLLPLFHEHPEYGMVFAQMWLADSNLAEHVGPFPAETQPQWGMQDLLRFIPQVGTIMVRQAVARQMRFDAALRWGEDWDWVLKIARSYAVGYAPVPVLLYRQHPQAQVQWRAFRDTISVFRRHARAFRFSARLKLQPALWARRGWFAALYMQQAAEYARARSYRQSTQAFWYALRASTPHVAVLLLRSCQAKLARARSAPASQAP